MAARGRRPGFQMSHEHRVKIQNSNVLNALIEHVDGKRDMSASQVTAALGLLRKALPDLQSIDMRAEHDVSDSLADLMKAIDGRTRGIPTSR